MLGGTLKIQELEAQVKSLRDRIKLCANSGIAIDFKAIKAISINRYNRYSRGVGVLSYTRICYISPDNMAREWECLCSQKKHEELVEQFKTYLASKV